MEAGPQLDILVAQHVMGWTEGNGYMVIRRPWGDYICHDSLENDLPPWSPSTDIAAAWQVVEKLRPNFNLVLECVSFEYNCHINPAGKLDQRVHARADTAPLAICLAALKAVGVDTR